MARRRAAAQDWRPRRSPAGQHFWLYAGVVSLVLHALLARAFTEPFVVHVAVVVVGALVTLVQSLARRD